MRRWQKVLLGRGRRRDVIVPVLSEADIKIGAAGWSRFGFNNSVTKIKTNILDSQKPCTSTSIFIFFIFRWRSLFWNRSLPYPPFPWSFCCGQYWSVLWSIWCPYHIALELFQCALLILGWSDFNSWWECIWPSLALERSWVALWSSRFWVQLWWTIS